MEVPKMVILAVSVALVLASVGIIVSQQISGVKSRIDVVEKITGAAPGSVTETILADSAVAEKKLASSAVTTDKIADGAVTSAKIADITIAATDIAPGAVTSAKILDGTIATADLADGVLSADTTGRAKMADGYVSSAKIEDGTIVNADIAAAAAIAGSKLAANSVTGTQLADNILVENLYASALVNTVDLTATGTLSLPANSVTSTMLADNILVENLYADNVNITTRLTIPNGAITDNTIENEDVATGFIQSGFVNATLTATAGQDTVSASVTFSPGFTSTPIVVISDNDRFIHAAVEALTTTGFTAWFVEDNAAVYTSGTRELRGYWIAILAKSS